MDTTTTSPETEFVSILGAAEKAETPPRISARSLPEMLPVLGLSDIVIGDRLFAAVLQRKAEIADPAPEDLYEVGCVTRLSKMVKFPDGTARVLVEGLWRIRVKNFTPPMPYLRAAYELLRDE